MSKSKKIGIVLILLGFCLPLLMFPFATKVHTLTPHEAVAYAFGHPTKADIIETIQNLEIVLREKRESLPAGFVDLDNPNSKTISKITIPYKNILAVSVLSLFMGIGFLLLGNKPPKSSL